MALRILLADDSMTAQNMGKKILTDAGFDVVTVSNGAAAVKKIAEAAPDMAILDVYMPGYTGLEVCERLKSTPATARVPVLLSVGKMEPFRPEDGMKVKADGVIIKPFEATDLVTVINKLAERCYGADAAPAAVEEAPAEEEINILDEPAPAREGQAEGLETFAPVAVAAPVAAAEGVEFTSAPKVGAVPDDKLQDLVPTVLPPEASEAPVEVAMPEMQPVQPVEAAAAPEEIPQAKAAAASMGQAAVADVISESAVLPEMPATAEALEAVPVEVASVPEIAEVAGAADWSAVEAEGIDPDADLDLEAEMMAAEAGVEEPIAEAAVVPQAPEAAATLSVAAMPFLSPMGKTSFDELDAVMASVEQKAQEAEIALPEPVEVEEPVAAVAEPAMEDEVLAGDDVVLPAVEDPVPPAVEESALLDVAEPVAAEQPEPDGLLDVAPSDPGAPALAEKDALAFYGLSDEFNEEPLRNPIEEADEPLFALEELTDAQRSATAMPEPAVIGEEASVSGAADVLDEVPADTAGDELDVLGADAPVAEAPVEEPVIEEAVIDEPVVDDPLIDKPAISEAAPEPVVEEAPIVEPPAMAEAVAEEEPFVPEIEELAPAALAAAAAPMVAAAVQSETEAVVSAPQAVAADETVVNAMVGRVVDRVVDRLKPVLTIMVEEILKEVKK